MNPLPRSEYPRPQLQRTHWLNLNGDWRFSFDPDLVGEQMGWYRPGHHKHLTITVPYPWESRLSGVAAPGYKGAAWYERELTIPDDWQGLVPILHFGAIDWQARVWINGRLVAEHENGYLPFSIDLRAYARPGETITVTVRAFDIADAATLLGKQVPRWYTFSSGIWQTVWLEGCAPSYVASLRVVPDVAGKQAMLHASLSLDHSGDYDLTVHALDGAFDPVQMSMTLDAGTQDVVVTIPIAEPRLWSPESPFLYNFAVDLTSSVQKTSDRVASYFGMRSVARGLWDGKSYEYILLNGEPVYLRGALDQAFHPDGLHAYPSDDAIRNDIQLAKDLGLNMLRCHIKINDPRYYYWADRLGMLVLYDLPSPDLDSPSMRQRFAEALQGAIERDYNSPSIIAWIIFNETWGLTNHDTVEGQQWVGQMVDLARRLDPTRLVEDNSPNKYDHVETDINSWHFYLNDYAQARRHIQHVVDETYLGSAFNYVGGEYVQKCAPLINSEYAGISARMGDLDISWSFKFLTNELRRHDKICGYVYTELADIEWEHNGFVNYDRSAKEFGYEFFVPDMGVADLNGADFVGVDAPPCATMAPGANWRVQPFVSHWGAPLGRGSVRWQLDFIDSLGERTVLQKGVADIEPKRFHVSTLDDLVLSLPHRDGLAILALWLEDEAGTVRSRNYVNAVVRIDEQPASLQSDRGWLLRFDPAAWSRISGQWPRVQTTGGGGKFAAAGAGWVEYDIPLPDIVVAGQVDRVQLCFEAGARAGMAKVDWPQQINGSNYPQTEKDKKYPTDLVVSLNGIEIGQVHLPDDPADARGVLSHHRGVDPGSYGYLVNLTVDRAQLSAILRGQEMLTVRFTIPDNAANRGGLSLYGYTMGCYPLNPTIIVTLGS